MVASERVRDDAAAFAARARAMLDSADVVLSIGGVSAAAGGTAEGYVDWLESVMGRVQNSSHMIHNHQVVLASATTAQGEVYLSGHTRLKVEGGWEDLTHGMRYIDHYRKTGESEKQSGRESRPGYRFAEPVIHGLNAGHWLIRIQVGDRPSKLAGNHPGIQRRAHH